MKRCEAVIRRIYMTERGRWVAGALFAVALYLLAVALQPVITFYDNDDLNIAWALAGYRSGAPSFSHPFINCLTAAAVSALYTVFPAVPWWYVVQTVCLVISVAVVAACMLRVSARRGLNPLVPVLLLAVVCAGTFYYAVAQVMFTLTSASLGMAAVAMAMAAKEDDGERAYARYLAGGALLLALSLLIRQSSGISAACFWGAAMLYRLLAARRAQRRVRPALRTLAVACAVVALLTGVNAWGRANQNADNFIEFENARAAYMDYPHDLQYENVLLYDEIGWDGALQGLVEAWFFMDARVNAETLQIAADGSAFANMTVSARAAYAAESVGVFLGKYPIAVYLCVITACAFVALAVVCAGNRRYLELLAGCAMLLGAAALLGYLFYGGRMNLRAMMSILFPAITALLMLTLCGAGPETASGGRVGRILRRAACGALALASLFSAYKIFRTVVSYDSVETLKTTRAVAAYAIDHPDVVCIRDVYTANNFDALTVYPDEKPTNLIDWGGCDTLTRAREAQWRKNGYARTPNAEAFLDENVRYLCDPADIYLPMLHAYLKTNYGAVTYEITEYIADGVAVVRFTAQGGEGS